MQHYKMELEIHHLYYIHHKENGVVLVIIKETTLNYYVWDNISNLKSESVGIGAIKYIRGHYEGTHL